MNVLRNCFRSLSSARRSPVPRPHRPQSRRPRPLFVENLEERTLLSILFGDSPNLTVVGSSTAPVLANAQVRLVFWGNGWTTGGGPALRTQVETAFDAINGGTYFYSPLPGADLSQYRSNIRRPVRVDSPIVTSSSPGQTFTNNDVFNMLSNQFGLTHNFYYYVIPQAGSTPTGCGCAAEHTYWFQNPDIDANREYYGFSRNFATPSLEDLTNLYSHEMAESITDPDGGATQVRPRPNPDPGGWWEIGDGEAQNYSYRLNGKLVQSYWSRADGKFTVPTGQSQNFFVSSSGVLTVNGDQLPNHNDTITLNEDAGGVHVTLNGEVAVFEPGTINSISVNSGTGNDVINVLRTVRSVPVTITNAGPATVNVGNAADGVQGIQGTVRFQGNFNGRTTFNVDDSGNRNLLGTTARQILPGDGFDYIHNLAPADILYRGVQTGAVHITLGGHANTFTVENTNTAGSGDATTIDTGTGNAANIVNVLGTDQTTPLTVVGHGPNTTVNVGNPGRGVQDIRGNVKLQGNFSGRTTLNVDDSGDTSDRLTAQQILPGDGFDYIHNLAPQADIVYRGVQTGAVTITLGTGTNNFAFLNTNTAGSGDATTLNTGTGNSVNTVSVLGTDLTTPLIVAGRGPNTTVNVANLANQLNDLHGPLTVNGQGSTTLNVNDRGTSTPKEYDIFANVVKRVLSPDPDPIHFDAVINYANIANLNVNGGSGGNLFKVPETAVNANTTLNGGSGNNTLNGPPAPTGFNIAGRNAGTLSGGATASFSNFQNLIGGSGNDNFIFADGAGIDGNISDLGGVGNSLDYRAYSTPITVDLSAGTATGVGGSVSNILTLRGGAGDDSLTGNAAGQTIFVASPGNDTITGLGAGNYLYNADGDGTADSTWSVTAQNSGTLTFPGATTTFSGVQNLNGGGSGSATFVFADGAGVDGNIQGSGLSSRANVLDYTAYASSNVLVNLQTGFATGVGGTIAYIRNVTGASGGPAGSYNILVGNGGNVLTGGNGRRNLLIAGGAGSTLIGGDQDDILIGGTTAYDAEAGMASLQAIMNYWAGSGDDYATRVNNLMTGTGVPLLDATTVTGNGGGNTLTGGGGMDLFYGNPALDTYDWDPATETFISV